MDSQVEPEGAASISLRRSKWLGISDSLSQSGFVLPNQSQIAVAPFTDGPFRLQLPLSLRAFLPFLFPIIAIQFCFCALRSPDFDRAHTVESRGFNLKSRSIPQIHKFSESTRENSTRVWRGPSWEKNPFDWKTQSDGGWEKERSVATKEALAETNEIRALKTRWTSLLSVDYSDAQRFSSSRDTPPRRTCWRGRDDLWTGSVDGTEGASLRPRRPKRKTKINRRTRTDMVQLSLIDPHADLAQALVNDDLACRAPKYSLALICTSSWTTARHFTMWRSNWSFRNESSINKRAERRAPPYCGRNRGECSALMMAVLFVKKIEPITFQKTYVSLFSKPVHLYNHL